MSMGQDNHHGTIRRFEIARHMKFLSFWAKYRLYTVTCNNSYLKFGGTIVSTGSSRDGIVDMFCPVNNGQKSTIKTTNLLSQFSTYDMRYVSVLQFVSHACAQLIPKLLTDSHNYLAEWKINRRNVMIISLRLSFYFSKHFSEHPAVLNIVHKILSTVWSYVLSRKTLMLIRIHFPRRRDATSWWSCSHHSQIYFLFLTRMEGMSMRRVNNHGTMGLSKIVSPLCSRDGTDNIFRPVKNRRKNHN